MDIQRFSSFFRSLCEPKSLECLRETSACTLPRDVPIGGVGGGRDAMSANFEKVDHEEGTLALIRKFDQIINLQFIHFIDRSQLFL